MVALHRPDLTLSADNAADLVRCAVETEKALAGGYAFAAGVLPYEAGAWLREVNGSSSVKGEGMHDHSVMPAVIHLYKGLPTPVRGSSAAPTVTSHSRGCAIHCLANAARPCPSRLTRPWQWSDTRYSARWAPLSR